MVDIILVVALIALVGGAVCYIYKAKKRGHTCIGCPHAKTCKNKCVK